MNTKVKTICLTACLLLVAKFLFAQAPYSLRTCLEYAVENNRSQKKMRYDVEKASYARKEVLGALLPQINASANLNDNLKKAKFIMPNFLNSMLPPQAQDPKAPKYMTVEMGTTYSANAGFSLNQQVVNFSLFNALAIAQTAEKLAALGAESNEEELIAQSAEVFYAIQSTEYAAEQMEKSIELVGRMLKTMEVNYANGLVRKTDLDRLKVNLVNLTTQKSAIENAASVQKNLLKLQMGLDVNLPFEVEAVDWSFFEEKASSETVVPFSLQGQTPYRLLREQMHLIELQKKSAIYENLPTLSLMLNYQYNGMSDQLFRGESNYWYPTSVLGLSLRVPIFSGFSRRSKIHQARMEELKAREDAVQLEQSLNMAYMNAQMKLQDARHTLTLQRDNRGLAEEVFRTAENNFVLGLSSLSDVLNASQSLVQAQLSYANALNECMKSLIELKKAGGNIRELMNVK